MAGKDHAERVLGVDAWSEPVLVGGLRNEGEE